MLSILVWRRVKVLFNVPAVLAHAVGQTVSVRLGVSSSSWTNKATLCSKQTYNSGLQHSWQQQEWHHCSRRATCWL